MSCFYTNADSLSNKFAELQFLVSSKSEKPHIIAITEAKPKNSRFIPSLSEFCLKDYEMYHVNMDAEGGRGILVYVLNTLSVSQVSFNFNFEESVWLELKLINSSKLLFGCVYRSPNSSNRNNDELINLLKHIDQQPQTHKVIVGDFNYGSINWDTWQNTVSDENADSNRFLTAMRDGYWIQNVKVPTRGRKNNIPSVLDLIISNEENIISNLEITSPLGKSDHSILNFNINSYLDSGRITKTIKYYDKGNYVKMREMLDINWENEFEDKTLEEKWNYFTERVKEAENDCIPTRKVVYDPTTSNKHKFKLDSNSLRRIKKKHTLWKRFLRTRDGEVYLQYCRERNYVRSMTRKFQKQIEREIAKSAKRNPKKFWKYVQSKTKVKSKVNDLEMHDDNGE